MITSLILSEDISSNFGSGQHKYPCTERLKGVRTNDKVLI